MFKPNHTVYVKKNQCVFMENKEDIFEKLCDAYSNQSKVLNKYWSLLIISSSFVILSAKNSEKTQLPLLSMEVESSDFYQISILIISMLTIGFCSAQAQSIRTRMLLNKVTKSFKNEFLINGKLIHINDFTDCIITSTYNRVAPISQFILGNNQFLGEGKQSKIKRWFGIVLYLILKISVLFFLYGIPSYAFFKCWSFLIVESFELNLVIPKILLYFSTIISGILLLIFFLKELGYTTKVFKYIKKKN